MHETAAVTNLQGMNVASIRDTARQFRSTGQQLEQIRAAIERLADQQFWKGPDAHQFKARWDNEGRRMVAACSQSIIDLATILERNSTEQERTSSTLEGGAGGGVFGPGGGVPGGGGYVGGGGGGGGGGGWGDDDSDETTGHINAEKGDQFAKGDGASDMIKGSDYEKNWGRNAELGPDGKPIGPPDKGIDPHFNVAHGSFGDPGHTAKGGSQLGSMRVDGEAGYKAGLFGDGTAYATKNGLGVEGSIAYGVEGSVKGSATLGVATVDGEIKGTVGAKADGSAELTWDPAHGVLADAHAGAFAGGKVEGHVGAEAGGVGASATGEAWAGIGLEANGAVGYKDGHFKLGASFGAAFGIGGKAGFEIDIDVPKTLNTLGSIASGVGHFFGF